MSGKRRSHALSFKREVLHWVFEVPDKPRTSYAAAKKFKKEGLEINRPTIQGWIANKDEILNLSNMKGSRLKGAGRKCALGEDLENELKDVILNEREEGNRVCGTDVQRWARELSLSANLTDFNASDGWLRNFLSRQNFSFRKVTNPTSLSDKVLIDRAVKFMADLQKGLSTGLEKDQCILMDESTVYLEDPRRVTINESGERQVNIKSTGFSSLRITVLLPVAASGRKLIPTIIFKKSDSSASNSTSLAFQNGCYVVINEKAWVNEAFIKSWLELTFPTLNNSSGNGIVWDSCPSHTSKSIKEFLTSRGIKNIVIPGGLTPYVQASDLGIHKSFKEHISPFIEKWKCSREAERTSEGNLKPPTNEAVCEWVLEAWRSVSEEVILNSIKAAGFGKQEDWMIYSHGVYGTKFRESWFNRDISVEVEGTQDDTFVDEKEEIIDDSVDLNIKPTN